MTKKPIEDRMGYPPKAALPPKPHYQAPKQPTPILKNKINPMPTYIETTEETEENPFRHDLPF